MWKLLSHIILLFALSFSAGADTQLSNARENLLSGEYDRAIEMGETMATAGGLSLAAESLSAKIMLGYVEDPKDSAKRARKLAGKALKLDSSSKEAHIQYALAYGFETQSSSPFRAWRKKLPQKTRAAIDVVRTKYPDEARGDALLGAWHLGIVRKAGAKRGAKMFDATELAGMEHYELALNKAPSDIIILSNYAAVLLCIDSERHHHRTAALLTRIFDAPASNAVEDDVKSRMLQFKPHLDDPKQLMMLAEKLLDGDRVNDLPPEKEE